MKEGREEAGGGRREKVGGRREGGREEAREKKTRVNMGLSKKAEGKWTK